MSDMETAVVYGGDWDLPDVIAALGALQGMEIKDPLGCVVRSGRKRKDTPKSSGTLSP